MEKPIVTLQDTGNPVLDSLVNLLVTKTIAPKRADILDAHQLLTELAAKEPGGLRHHKEWIRIARERQTAQALDS